MTEMDKLEHRHGHCDWYKSSGTTALETESTQELQTEQAERFARWWAKSYSIILTKLSNQEATTHMWQFKFQWIKVK